MISIVKTKIARSKAWLIDQRNHFLTKIIGVFPGLAIPLLIKVPTALAATDDGNQGLTRHDGTKAIKGDWNDKVAPFLTWGGGVFLAVSLLIAMITGIAMAKDTAKAMQQGNANELSHQVKNWMQWIFNTALVAAGISLVSIIFGWVLSIYNYN